MIKLFYIGVDDQNKKFTFGKVYQVIQSTEITTGILNNDDKMVIFDNFNLNHWFVPKYDWRDLQINKILNKN